MGDCVISINDTRNNIEYVVYQDGESTAETNRALQQTLSNMQSVEDTIKSIFGNVRGKKIEKLDQGQISTLFIEHLKMPLSDSGMKFIQDLDVRIVHTDKEFVKTIITNGKKILVIGWNGDLSEHLNIVHIFNALADLITEFGTIKDKNEQLSALIDFASLKDEENFKKQLSQILQALNDDQETLKKDLESSFSRKYQYLFYKGNFEDTIFDKWSPIQETTILTEGDLIQIDGEEYIYYGQIPDLYNSFIYAMKYKDKNSNKIPISQVTLDQISRNNITNVKVNLVDVTDINISKFSYKKDEETDLQKHDLIPGAIFSDPVSNKKYRVLANYIKNGVTIALIQDQDQNIAELQLTDNITYKGVSPRTKISQQLNISRKYYTYIPNFSSLSLNTKQDIFKRIQLGDAIVIDGLEYKVNRKISKSTIQVSDSNGKNSMILDLTNANISEVNLVDHTFLQRYQTYKLKHPSSKDGYFQLDENEDLSKGDLITYSITDKNGTTKINTAIILSKVNDTTYTVMYAGTHENNNVYRIENIDLSSTEISDIQKYSTDPEKKPKISSLYTPTSQNISDSELEQDIIQRISEKLGLPVIYDYDSTKPNKLAWTDLESITINLAACKDGKTILQNFTHELTHIYLAYIRLKTPEVYIHLLETLNITENQLDGEKGQDEAIVDKIMDIVVTSLQKYYDGTIEKNQINLLNILQNAFNKIFDIRKPSKFDGTVWGTTIKNALQQYRKNNLFDLLYNAKNNGLKYKSLQLATANFNEIEKIDINCE